MTTVRPDLPHGGTRRSTGRGATLTSPAGPNTFDGIPEPLVTAIRAAVDDPDLPAQGFPSLREHVLAGGSRPDEEELSCWLAEQARSQRLVKELIVRLPPATPGFVPPHHLEWWFRTLPYPWAEDLTVAVVHGFLELA